jgi:NADPH-dependent 2,4-dienoyl-CoA reductase/sulfur reductase-like enzyme
MRIYRYVILGGGVAAGYTVQELVKNGLAPGELAIISADDTPPYDRPPLSKAYLAGSKTRQDILINPPEFYERHGIDVLLDTLVKRVDLDERRLFTASGEEIEFEQLVITTGSRVRKLTIPNSYLEGIHYLRLREDSQRIREHALQAKRIALVGGGYIGMEVSAVLASMGSDVTVVFPEERLMERLFTPPMSAFFQDYYEQRGVKFMPGTKPAAFLGDGSVSGLLLDNRELIEADMVVAGIGVTPALDLFEASDLHIDNGIVLNKYLESNLSHVFAAGDVANYYDVLFQKSRRIEHWDNAV